MCRVLNETPDDELVRCVFKRHSLVYMITAHANRPIQASELLDGVKLTD